MLDRHVGRGILLELTDLPDVLGLRPRELLLAVRECYVRARRTERDRGLQRRVAAADDKDLPAGELLGVVETVEDLVEAFAGAPKPSVVAAPADRHDDAARLRHGPLVPVMEEKGTAFALDSFNVREGDFNAGGLALGLERLEQFLLRVDFGLELEIACRGHVCRVGVDRLPIGEVHDSGKDLRRLEDLERQARLLRLDRGGDAGNAGSHDGDVQDLRVVPARPHEIRLGEDPIDGPRARVGGELQQWYARQVAHDAHTGHRRRPVCPDFRQFLDGPCGPHRVQPVGVTGDPVHGERALPHVVRCRGGEKDSESGRVSRGGKLLACRNCRTFSRTSRLSRAGLPAGVSRRSGSQAPSWCVRSIPRCERPKERNSWR